jgi:hypothetical protein
LIIDYLLFFDERMDVRITIDNLLLMIDYLLFFEERMDVRFTIDD